MALQLLNKDHPLCTAPKKLDKREWLYKDWVLYSTGLNPFSFNFIRL